MKRHTILVFGFLGLILLAGVSSFGQTFNAAYWTRWLNDTNTMRVDVDGSGNLYVSGELYSYFYKLDGSGNVIFSKKINAGTTYNYFRDVLVDSGGIYLAQLQGYIHKLTPMGQISWSRKLTTGKTARTWDLERTADGNYLAGSFIDDYQISLIKFSGNGSIVWQRLLNNMNRMAMPLSGRFLFVVGDNVFVINNGKLVCLSGEGQYRWGITPMVGESALVGVCGTEAADEFIAVMGDGKIWRFDCDANDDGIPGDVQTLWANVYAPSAPGVSGWWLGTIQRSAVGEYTVIGELSALAGSGDVSHYMGTVRLAGDGTIIDEGDFGFDTAGVIHAIPLVGKTRNNKIYIPFNGGGYKTGVAVLSSSGSVEGCPYERAPLMAASAATVSFGNFSPTLELSSFSLDPSATTVTDQNFSVHTICECTAPLAVASPVPDSGAAVCNPVTVSWTGSGAATSYDVTLDGAAVPGCTGIAASSCAMGSLSSGTHSWSVMTNGTCGNTPGPAWTIRIDSAAPGAVAYIAPANGATVCSPVTFSWSAVADATAYDLMVDGIVAAADLTAVVSPPANLSQGAHTWQVIAKNGCGNTPGPIWSLTANALPGTVSAPVPSSGASVCAPVLLSWAASVSTLPVTYDVFVDGILRCNSVAGTTCNPGALTDGNHTWSVTAKTACGSTPGGDWTFRSYNAAPAAVTGPIPPHQGATCSPVILLWTASPTASSYDVLVDGAPVCSDVTVTNCGAGALALGPHTWQVIAQNPCGNTAGPVWAFTVASDVPSNPASNPSPAVGALVCNPVTLAWTPGAGSSYHDLFIDGRLVVSDLAAASYDAGDLTGGAHSWYLVSNNGCAATATSPTWTFTVNPAHAPEAPVLLSPRAGDYVCPPLTLYWEASDNAESYDVYVDFDLVCPDTHATFCRVGDVSEGLHAWYVVAKNACTTLWSAPIPFTVSFQPPGQVSGPSPADGANVVAPVTLSWAPAPGALTYDLLLDGNLLAGDYPGISYRVSALTPGMHDWVVVAKSACGSNVGPTWSFNNVLYATEWIRTFGGSSSDAGTVVATDDAGRTLLAGWTTSYGASGKDAWALAVDATGLPLWQRTFGSGGDDALYAAAPVSGGRWILAGGTRSFGRAGWDFWLLLVGESGNIIWQTAAGGDGDEIVRGVVPTADGGFVAVGETDSFGAGGRDFWIVKFSASGTVLWQKVVGGAGDDLATGVLSNAGDGVLVFGYTYSVPGREAEACAVLLNNSGFVWSSYTYGTDAMDAFYAGIADEEGDRFVLAGNTDAPGGGHKDVFLVGLEHDGRLAWKQTVGGPSIEQAFALSASADGGFVLGGSSRSFGAGSYDFWLVKFGPARAIEWQKVITGAGDEKIYGLAQTADQGFLAVGETYTYGAGGSDLWAVKIGGEGDFRGCGLALATETIPAASSASSAPINFGGAFTTAGYEFTQAQTRLPEAETAVQCECARVTALPELAAPLNGSVTASVNVPLSWAASQNADSYVVYLGTSMDAMEAVATTVETQWTAFNLKAGTAYFWAITAVSPCNEAPAAPRWFETPGASPLGDRVYFLPVAARVDGAQNSHWITDCSLMNRSDQAVAYTLTFIPGGFDGARGAKTHRAVLDARRMAVHPDLLWSAFGLEGGSGWVKIESAGPLALGARVYHRGVEGSYGQFVPGFELSAGAPLLRTPDKGYLIHLANSDRYRSNIGFTEPTGQSATAVISLYDASGNYLGGMRQPVPAGGQIQVNNIFRTLGIGTVDAARAEIAVEGAGALLAYASVVDSGTNDAIFMPATRKIAVSMGEILPVVTHLKGDRDTTWRSDVRLYNAMGPAQTISLTYRWGTGQNTVSRTLLPGRLDDLQDVVAALFPEAGESSGSLLIEHDGGILSSSRTYNLEEKGTYGQFVPSLQPAQAFGPGEVGTIPLLSSTAAYRSNVGFTETLGYPATVEGSLYNAEGELLGRKTWEIPALGHLQENIFTAMQVEKEVYFAYLEVKVIGGYGAGSVACYASVVDNLSGDAIYIPAQ